MARAFFVWIVIMVLATLGPAEAGPGPPAPPPNPTLAVPRHLEAVSDHLSDARTPDRIGQRALAEARTSLSAARLALATHALRTADELAASADDLIRAADGPPQHGQGLDPAQILARVDGFAAVLVTVQDSRVQTLLTFARDVTDLARQKAARSEADAGWEAARAEAIARAATHVAIAADPSLAPALPPPRPPNPPPGRPS